MLKLFITLIFLTVFLISNRSVLATTEVKINELLADPPSSQGEWVELYFPSGSFDISNYYLLDIANNKKSLDTLENCGDYSVYNLVTAAGSPTDSWLNNSGQESIFLYDQSDNLIDSFEGWSNPGENKTLGRIPDGSGNWAETETPTKCSQNSQAQPSPSPTPSPNPPNPSPSPTVSSTATTAPSPPTQKPISSKKVLGESQKTATKQAQKSTPKPQSPSPSSSAQQNSSSKTKVATLLTGSGIVLVGLSIGFFLWYKRLLGKPEDHKSKKEQGD